MRLIVAAVVAVPATIALAAPPTFIVLAEGDAAPTVPGATISDISDFTSNKVGQVALRVLMPQGVGGVTGTTAQMLLRYSVTNGLERVARSGSAVPAQPGELFGGIFNWAGGQCMNDAGNVVFRSTINSAKNTSAMISV